VRGYYIVVAAILLLIMALLLIIAVAPSEAGPKGSGFAKWIEPYPFTTVRDLNMVEIEAGRRLPNVDRFKSTLRLWKRGHPGCSFTGASYVKGSQFKVQRWWWKGEKPFHGWHVFYECGRR
jgi:hypothetical protein